MEIIKNKRALHDYKVLEKWQAGLKLSGPEVKAIKMGRIDLKNGYVDVEINPYSKTSELWLAGVQISKYPKSGYSQRVYNPQKKRKLLLKRKEIDSLVGKIKQKGLTIIPTSVYTSQRLIKVEIALVQGKKKFDKREELKKRDFERRKRKLMKY